jgi:uncharacterized protein
MSPAVGVCRRAALLLFSLSATLPAGAAIAGGEGRAPKETTVGQDPAGIWSGSLDIPGGVTLRLVFRVERERTGELKVLFDSPDQGARDIPAAGEAQDDGRVVLQIPKAGASFEGRWSAEGTLVGDFVQAGRHLPMVLARVSEAPKVLRPQEPRPPFPYRVEDVTFQNAEGGVRLAGTLTLPESPRPLPAVVLITGSGPQDRDEALFGHRPFWIIADSLSRQGYAVLRYDDRGVGASTGTFSSATSLDFMADALAGVAYLKGRREIDRQRIGLLGHSEGALIAALGAGRDSDVAFIVLLAPPMLPIDQILLNQEAAITRAHGESEGSIASKRASSERILALAKAAPDAAAFKTAVASVLAADATLDAAARAAMEQEAKSLASTWMRWLLVHDVARDLARVRCPVLALIGEKDLQVVPIEANLALLKSGLAAGGNTKLTAKVLPGLNHAFQTAKTGSPLEYGVIEETVSPRALEEIGSWMSRNVPPS